MFRANPQRTGVYQTSSLRQFNQVKWTLQVAMPSVYRDACPAIADGVICVGSSQGSFYAIDAEAGYVKWTFNLEGRTIGSPTIADGVVYVVGSNGIFYAINLQTGFQQWQYKITEQLAYGEYYSPVVADGVVYVGCYNGYVYALATQTGQQLWVFETTGEQLTSALAIADGVLYVGSSCGRISAIALDTRQQKWSVQVPLSVALSGPFLPVVTDRVVYGSANAQGLIALDIQTGEQIWIFEPGSENSLPWTLLTRPAVAEGIICVGSSNKKVYALEALTGRSLWVFSTGGESMPSAPVIADGIVYIGTLNIFWALELQTGNLLWTFKPPEPTLRLTEPKEWIFVVGRWAAKRIWGYSFAKVCPPAIADGVVYVEACEDSYTILCALQ